MSSQQKVAKMIKTPWYKKLIGVCEHSWEPKESGYKGLTSKAVTHCKCRKCGKLGTIDGSYLYIGSNMSHRAYNIRD